MREDLIELSEDEIAAVSGGDGTGFFGGGTERGTGFMGSGT